MNATALLACSVCFGDPGSLQSKGAAMGVLTLLGVVVFVLGGVAATLLSWIRRARPPLNPDTHSLSGRR